MAVNFISYLKHTKGEWFGKNFDLIDWQEQIIRDVFGTMKPNGYRQFNTAYIEIAKKQGKSELAAAVALLLTCGDFEHGGEVYGCAADRQQASIVFDVAVDMVEQSPALKARFKPVLSQKRLIYKPLGSFYQVLSAEAYTKPGLNVHGVVFDELHAQPNRRLYDVMTHGSGDARKQPLYFLITTAGNDQHSICYEVHQKAKDAGATTRFSASESAEALNYLALAGYDTEQAIGALPGVLTLAAAGDMDLARASDLVTDSMAALGLEIADMDMYMDKMAKTSQKSNTDVQQLG